MTGWTSPLAPLAPPSRWERIALACVLAVFVFAGLNAIGNGAYQGQDYPFHINCVNRLIRRPDVWFFQDTTSRPLTYWIAANAIAITGNRAPIVFTSVLFLACNTGALWLLYDCSRRAIASPVLRVAALAFIALLPVSVITSVVFAADAMATPLFVLLGWSLLRWTETNEPRGHTLFAALAGLALVLGNFTKATFLVLPAGVVVVGLLAWRWSLVTRWQALAFLACAAALPTAVGAWLHLKAKTTLANETSWHRVNLAGTGEMTWRSLLLPKAGDTRIFNAPGYCDYELVDGRRQLPLLYANNYSYPALLHLAIYTDVMNLADGGSDDEGTPRRPRQHAFATAAVRTATLFSITWAAALALTLWHVLRGVIRPATAPPLAVGTWLILAANWFLPLVLVLPLMHHAYDWGYWLPRLTLPALWFFALCFFAQLARFADARPRLSRVVATAVAAQSLLHVCSLWY